MAMKNVGMTVCAMLLLVPASWGENPPKKYHTGSSHPYHSLAQTQASGHKRSSGSSALLSKSQSGREREVERLERENTVPLQNQSKQRSAKTGGQAPRIHPEPTGRGSGINFSYHPPRTPTTGSGSRKH
jgi:hypothetical protein